MTAVLILLLCGRKFLLQPIVREKKEEEEKVETEKKAIREGKKDDLRERGARKKR